MLGALHGPAELLPISSSGHIALLPWLLGWDYNEADAELRKAFEVALHAGTAAALLITLRTEVSDAMRDISLRIAELIALSFVPPAIVGYTLERPIERRLGTPGTIALGLVLGSVAMARADRTPQTRTSHDAGLIDALCLGLAQACALLPGVSRNGATLAAARRRGFTREDANKLSRHVALPVIAGATLLKTVRLARRGCRRAARCRSASAPPPRSHRRWARRGSSARWSATGRCSPMPRTAWGWRRSCSPRLARRSGSDPYTTMAT